MNPDAGYSTKPLVVGAPLPEEMVSITAGAPTQGDIADELNRAQVELFHAIARHRKAWAKARFHRDEARQRAIWAEAYNPYKLATADVRWWREEMTAQATTVTALLALHTHSAIVTGQPTDNPRVGPAVRETVWSWSGTTTPTPEQVAGARIWMRLNAADLDHAGRMRREDWAHCKLLLVRAGAQADRPQHP